MAHRYGTRSKSPMLVIDLTEDVPRRRGRPKRRPIGFQVTDVDPPSEQRMKEKSGPPNKSGPGSKDREKDSEDEASSLPCSNSSFSSAPEVVTCPICFGSMSASREPMATRCGHIFCTGCLTASLKKRKRCPTCQALADVSTCIRLYFC